MSLMQKNKNFVCILKIKAQYHLCIWGSKIASEVSCEVVEHIMTLWYHTGQYAGENQNQIKPAHRPIYYQCSLWPQPEKGAGWTTVTPWGHQTYQKVSLWGCSKKGEVDFNHTHQWFWFRLV